MNTVESRINKAIFSIHSPDFRADHKINGKLGKKLTIKTSMKLTSKDTNPLSTPTKGDSQQQTISLRIAESPHITINSQNIEFSPIYKSFDLNDKTSRL